VEWYPIDLADFIPDTGYVSHGPGSRPPYALDHDLVVFVDVIKGPVSWKESGEKPTIFNKLDPDAFPDG